MGVDLVTVDLMDGHPLGSKALPDVLPYFHLVVIPSCQVFTIE